MLTLQGTTKIATGLSGGRGRGIPFPWHSCQSIERALTLLLRSQTHLWTNHCEDDILWSPWTILRGEEWKATGLRPLLELPRTGRSNLHSSWSLLLIQTAHISQHTGSSIGPTWLSWDIRLKSRQADLGFWQLHIERFFCLFSVFCLF